MMSKENDYQQQDDGERFRRQALEMTRLAEYTSWLAFLDYAQEKGNINQAEKHNIKQRQD